MTTPTVKEVVDALADMERGTPPSSELTEKVFCEWLKLKCAIPDIGASGTEPAKKEAAG